MVQQIGRRSLTGFIGLFLLGVATPASAAEPQDVVDAATRTLTTMLADPEMDWLRANIRRARGAIVAPSIVKAGFIFGGSGGNAVVLVRTDAGLAGPAFYKLGAATFGFQAGVSDSQVVTLIMTEKAVKSLAYDRLKIGGEVSAAAGPVGAGATRDVDADFITFSRSRGLYGGLNLEGASIEANQRWNDSYNGASAARVLEGATRANAGAARLRAAMAGGAR
jgi:SH3 domain-containing YSC84-like protein 1